MQPAAERLEQCRRLEEMPAIGPLPVRRLNGAGLLPERRLRRGRLCRLPLRRDIVEQPPFPQQIEESFDVLDAERPAEAGVALVADGLDLAGQAELLEQEVLDLAELVFLASAFVTQQASRRVRPRQECQIVTKWHFHVLGARIRTGNLARRAEAMTGASLSSPPLVDGKLMAWEFHPISARIALLSGIAGRVGWALSRRTRGEDPGTLRCIGEPGRRTNPAERRAALPGSPSWPADPEGTRLMCDRVMGLHAGFQSRESLRLHGRMFTHSFLIWSRPYRSEPVTPTHSHRGGHSRSVGLTEYCLS